MQTSGAWRGEAANVCLELPRHCERSEAIHGGNKRMDCFAEPVIGRRFAPTRWLAMTVLVELSLAV
jgi:hypothetical protein